MCHSSLCTHAGAVLRWGRGSTFPQIHLLPHIQKLADRYDVISEVQNAPKIQIYHDSAPDPAGGAYSAPQNP